MKITSKIKGIVQTDNSEKRITNVKVVILPTLKDNNKEFKDNRRTNSNGEFEFLINLDEKPYLKRKEIYIGVVDENDNLISNPIKVSIKNINDIYIITINKDVNLKKKLIKEKLL